MSNWGSSTRRANLGVSGYQLQRDRARIIERDGGVCHVCGKPGADEVDHVVPVSEGGRHVDSNLAAIHRRPCHEEKTKREAARARARRSRRRPPEPHPGLKGGG